MRYVIALALLAAACGTDDLVLKRGTPIWSVSVLAEGDPARCEPGLERRAFDTWPAVQVYVPIEGSNGTGTSAEATTDEDIREAVAPETGGVEPEPGRTFAHGRLVLIDGVYSGGVFEGTARRYEPGIGGGTAAAWCQTYPNCPQWGEALPCVYHVTVTAR